MGHYRTIVLRLLPPLAALLVAVAVAVARPLGAQPAEVRRVVRTFDFEERHLGNPEDVPMHWTKVQGPGFPHYVNGRLSTDLPRAGRYSFRLDLNGGSAAYRYDASRIPVMAGAHYRIEAAVRTTVLRHARARLSAWLADQDGRALAKTVRHCDPYAARTADEDWHRVAIELSADDPKASFLVLELGLLQPAQHAARSLGQRTLDAQDIRGTAWFDDITVSQVPRVVMTTDRPGNVFRRGDPVRLQVRVDDRFTDDLAARIVVADADGRVVHQQSGTAELERAERVGPGRRRLPIDLPELPAGWYQATLVTSSPGQPLGRQAMSFVQLADADPPARPDGRFGFVATGLPLDGWDDLPQVLPLLSAGRVKLALWGPQSNVLEVDPTKFDGLLDRLQANGITPTGCLLDLPPGLAARLASPEGSVGVSEYRSAGVKAAAPSHSDAPTPRNPDTSSSWPLLLRADPSDWQPQLAFLVSRHANHLDRWQLGADGDESFVADPNMRRVYDEVYAQFRKLMQKPDLAMPWPAAYELDDQAPASVALSVPPALVLPSQVPLYLSDAGATAGGGGRPRPSNVSVYLSWLDADRYGRPERLRDMAQRVIHTLAAGAGRIDLPLPLSARREQDVLVYEPAEDLIILRTIVTTLAGANFKGKVPIADGIEAFLFDRGGQGVLAVWDRGSQQRNPRELAVNLGPAPTRIDLWGNVTPVQKVAGADGRASLSVGRTPILLVDIDGQLLGTRASVAFDRPLIESSFQPHVRRLRFTNGYKAAAGGTVRLKPPPGWGVDPPAFNFSLNPGEVFEKEVTIELPYNTLAGPKTIDAQFAIRADGDAKFTVPITVTLGLSDVGMQTIALRDGNDVVVQQTITNYGDKPIDYSAFAVLPGQPRQERLVSGLAAGKSTLKRYRFAGAEIKDGAKVRAGVKETAGTRILNEEVTVQ